MTRYRLAGSVQVTASSTLHDVHAVAPRLSGWLDAVIADGRPDVAAAYLVLPAADIAGDHPVFTQEIARRLEAGRFPLVRADVTAVGAPSGGRHPVSGELDLHGVRQPVDGSAIMRVRPDGVLKVDGRLLLDVRRFDLKVPRLLGPRVRPLVDVRLRILATPETLATPDARA